MQKKSTCLVVTLPAVRGWEQYGHMYVDALLRNFRFPHPSFVLSNPVFPENLARAVPELRRQLGTLDLVVFPTFPERTSSTPDTFVRDVELEFRRHVLALLNIVVELKGLFRPDSKVIMTIQEPSHYSSVSQFIQNICPAAISMVRAMPTFEKLDVSVQVVQTTPLAVSAFADRLTLAVSA